MCIWCQVRGVGRVRFVGFFSVWFFFFFSSRRRHTRYWRDWSSDVCSSDLGTTLHGPDGYKRLILFFAENFPDSRVELTNAFATQDQVALECTVRWNDTGPLYLPSGALPRMRRSSELRYCLVFEFRNGKIVSLHSYYDMVTQLEQLGLVPAGGQATE